MNLPVRCCYRAGCTEVGWRLTSLNWPEAQISVSIRRTCQMFVCKMMVMMAAVDDDEGKLWVESTVTNTCRPQE